MRDALAVFILRIGLGGVFLWFGVDKCFDPASWYGWVPASIQNRLPISMDLFLIAQGVVEAILGFFLVTGFLTRLSSLACSVILIAIVYFSGFNEIMIRDLGLLAAALSLLMTGAREISFDRLFFHRRK